jgi:hypothetical protein
MDPTLFKPDEDTTEDETKEYVQEALALFSLKNEQIALLLDTLEASPETYSDAKISDLLDLDIALTVAINSALLHIIHTYDHHIPSSKEIEKELVSAGCEQAKVTDFVQRLGTLNDKTKNMADALMFGQAYVEDEPHMGSLSWGINYVKMKAHDEEKTTALLPIVVLQIGIEQEGEQDRKMRLYFPIAEVGRFAKVIDRIAKQASTDVKSLKKEMDAKVLIPEG